LAIAATRLFENRNDLLVQTKPCRSLSDLFRRAAKEVAEVLLSKPNLPAQAAQGRCEASLLVCLKGVRDRNKGRSRFGEKPAKNSGNLPDAAWSFGISSI
jgi:hypothetical protein